MRAHNTDSSSATTPADTKPETPVFLCVREVAALLGISAATVRRWAARGEIPEPLRIGKTVRWSQRELLEVLEYRQKGGDSVRGR